MTESPDKMKETYPSEVNIILKQNVNSVSLKSREKALDIKLRKLYNLIKEK